jgi:serine/threonine protein kinase
MQWVKGTTLQNGKYVIEDVLGQGGFGTTYKARHTEINHSVAFKTPNAFLKHDPDYDKYIKSFIKEAKRIAMMAREPHPHLVRFTDYFLEGDIPCLVMEFVDGKTLFELVRQRGALPEVEVVTLLQEIGGALQWMHDRNLVHRDVNPANIMISRGGRSVLIDLGAAQEISPTIQSSTKMAGNQGFAPYEQLMDGVRDVRCDVYSLAATAYFAVTGVRPPGSFQRKIKGESLQEPATRVALSGELNRAIVEGMALELKERPSTVKDWLTGIDDRPQRGKVTILGDGLPDIQHYSSEQRLPDIQHYSPEKRLPGKGLWFDWLIKTISRVISFHSKLFSTCKKQLITNVLEWIKAIDSRAQFPVTGEILELPFLLKTPFLRLKVVEYIVYSELGHGGFGITYKALNARTRQYVAIKTLRESLRRDEKCKEYLRRFSEEAKLVKRISIEPHKNLVRFVDYFCKSNTPYLIMEYVSGRTLFDEVLKRGKKLSEERAIQLIYEVGGALQRMHDHALVHRDVNPANIMICEDGRTVLIDLGIAEEITPEHPISTRAGLCEFAPYEQFWDGLQDVRCDVYSLAASVYFAVTGEKPIKSPKRKATVLEEGIDPLQEPAMRVQVSQRLNQAIMLGMALDIDDRPSTLKDWIASIS